MHHRRANNRLTEAGLLDSRFRAPCFFSRRRGFEAISEADAGLAGLGERGGRPGECRGGDRVDVAKASDGQEQEE